MARRKGTVTPHTAFRSPTRNGQRNGQVWNAKLYPEIGGAEAISRKTPGSSVPLTINHTK